MAMVLANKTGKEHGVVFEFKAPVISTYEDIASGVEQGLVSKALVVAFFNHGADLKCRALGKSAGPTATEKAAIAMDWAKHDPDGYIKAQASCTTTTDDGIDVVDPKAWDAKLRGRFHEMAEE